MISVVLATHNEEKAIKKCLEAVKSIADEIIVVDGESTDQTVKLAEDLGAKVIKTTNKLNFHINKQMAIDNAKGNLILQLDADEIVDKDLLSFIKQLHANLVAKNWKLDENEPAAWWLKRRNFFLGKFLTKGGQYPDPVIRLFISKKASLPQKDVHEQMKVDGSVGWAEGHLLHYGNPTFSDYLRKFNTYTSFKAKQLEEEQTQLTFGTSIKYLLFLPLTTFFSLFIRHKGFVDGVPGFVFASFSGLHHTVAFLKLWENYENKKTI